MIILDSSTRSLQLGLEFSVPADLWIAAFCVDVSVSGRSPAYFDTEVSGAGDHEIVPAPVDGVYRELSFLTVHNANPSSTAMWISILSGVDSRVLCELSLPSQSTLTYTEAEGFRVLAYSGELLTGSVPAADALALLAATDFSNPDRFSESLTGGGASTFDENGLTCETSATATSSCKESWAVVVADNGGGLATVVPASASINCSLGSMGTDVQAFVGLGDIPVSGTAIDFTGEHIGFKVVRSSSGDAELFATQGDGGSESASDPLTIVAVDDQIDLAIELVDGATTAQYRWRLNGSAWSDPAVLSSNYPATDTGLFSMAISNAGVATDSALAVKSASYSR